MPRSGFTLVEILVVVAIVAILVALIFPSVQASRESARRTQCFNNLRQIGAAIRAYEHSNGFLPAGYSTMYPATTSPSWGWGTTILPWLEQTNLHDQLRPSERLLGDLFKSGASAADKALLQTPIATYRCPSDNSPTLNTLAAFGPNFFPVATSNYVANAGNDSRSGSSDTRLPQSAYYNNGGVRYCASYWDTDPGGPFFGMRDRRSSGPGPGPDGLGLDRVFDGASNVIAVGERDAWHYAAVWVGVADDSSFQMQDKVPRAIARPHFFVNFDFIAARQPENHGKGFASRHPGGADYVFLDGAVKFIADDLPSMTLQQLGNRRDNRDLQVPSPAP